jgi:tRNA threonylcarbamoyladenosine biosynthesis protein TsaB
LRLGLATAQGLALALGCPVVPVPTLEVLAAPLAGNLHPVAVVVDAKRREVYLGRFDCRSGFPEPLGKPERLAVEDLPGRLRPPVLITGPGLRAYEDFLMEGLTPGALVAPKEVRYPQATTVGRLGRHRLAQGLTVAPPQLTPLYLRPAL